MYLSCVQFPMDRGELATAIAIFIYSSSEPIICPFRQLRVRSATMDTCVLRVGRPIFSNENVCPDSLVEPISKEITLYRCHFPLMEAMGIFKAWRSLPTYQCTTYQVGSVMVIVSLVRFKAFTDLIYLISIGCSAKEDNYFHYLYVRFTSYSCAFRSNAASYMYVCRVCFSILVPGQTDISGPFSQLCGGELAPQAFQVFYFRCRDPLIEISPGSVGFAIIIAGNQYPCAIAIFQSFQDFGEDGNVKSNDTSGYPIRRVLKVRGLRSKRTIRAK